MQLINAIIHIDKLGDIVNKYDNKYTKIKVKPVDVKPGTYQERSYK